MVSIIPKGSAGVLFRLREHVVFDPLFHDWTAIAMGAFDASTGTALGRHIFVSEKADYYKIKDGLPQNQI